MNRVMDLVDKPDRHEMEMEMEIGLADKLDIHRLDVTPKDTQSRIEVELHATIRDVGRKELELLTGSRMRLEAVTCSVTSGTSDINDSLDL